ncbi:MAG: glycosyltransferase family 2 protein [Acidobacteriota bacterium]
MTPPSTSSQTDAPPAPTAAAGAPRLSAVVVHWRDGEHLEELLASWPRDPRFELLVVDNSAAEAGPTHPQDPEPARWLRPEANLGFAGGANFGIRRARAPWVLLLNPDARPVEGALEALLQGIEKHPEAAGLAPAMEGDDGSPQHRWQLRPLPSRRTLLLHCLLLPAGQGSTTAPAAGSAVQQPAAAALALRRQVVLQLGGLDDGFYPAWFEDVDIALRLHQGGHRLIYWPQARFVHAMGASVSSLGYGSFSWIYYRGLARYLEVHHGKGWRLLGRCALTLGVGLRLLALPLRRPRRARSRGEAAKALLQTMAGAISDFHWPAAMAQRYRRPVALETTTEPAEDSP